MDSGIYGVFCKSNLAIYIGQSFNLPRRLREHKQGLVHGNHKNAHLQAAWNLYGADAFTFSPLSFVELDELTAAEDRAMRDFRASGMELFNLTPAAGTTRGYKHTEETRQKYSDGQLRKRKADPEFAAKANAQLAHARQDPEIQARAKIAHKAAMGTPEMRQRLKERAVKQFSDPQERARLVAQADQLRSDPAVKEKWRQSVKATFATASYHQKRSAIASKNMADPVRRARISRTLRGTDAPRYLIAPDNTEHSVVVVNEFCRQRNLNPSGIRGVLAGRSKSYKGWRISKTDQSAEKNRTNPPGGDTKPPQGEIK